MHCIKQGFAVGNEEEKATALTNHFKVTLPNEPLYEYKIEGLITEEEKDSKNKPTRDRRRVFKDKAIAESKALSS